MGRTIGNNTTWSELDLKLAVQEAQGNYERLCAAQEDESSDRLDIAVSKAKHELTEAYRALKDYAADMAS